MSTEKEIKCKDCGGLGQSGGWGLCGSCYQRRKLKGEYTDKVCSVNGCKRPFYAKGMCSRHRNQILRHEEIVGDPGRTSRMANTFRVICDSTIIDLFNKLGEKVGEAIIDSSDANMCLLHQWHLTVKGYVESRINGKLVKLHQFVTGTKGLDHIDRNPLNNKKENLRECSHSQNLANSRGRGGTSAYKGVWMPNGYSKWCCAITHNGKRHWLGAFNDEKDAALAYNKKARELAGEFAYLNEVR